MAEMSELLEFNITWINSDISVSSHATLLSEKFTLATGCNSLPLPQLTEMSELPGGRDVRTSRQMVGAGLHPLLNSDISAIPACARCQPGEKQACS
ncbi:hypothetical protein [Deinococcus depolymerans]|uniref:hypothetical protein n=1 Tax=Deinococcus depolymerans TaxID=392408 RepID=UPI0031D64C19